MYVSMEAGIREGAMLTSACLKMKFSGFFPMSWPHSCSRPAPHSSTASLAPHLTKAETSNTEICVISMVHANGQQVSQLSQANKVTSKHGHSPSWVSNFVPSSPWRGQRARACGSSIGSVCNVLREQISLHLVSTTSPIKSPYTNGNMFFPSPRALS